MEELKKLISRMTEDLKEINEILAARSRELDQRDEDNRKIYQRMLEDISKELKERRKT